MIAEVSKRLCSFRTTIFLTRRVVASFPRAPSIAVVGSGPAGLYVCAGVLRRLPECFVDIYESSMVPYGLVRYGVAPDHPELKNCLAQFDKMFEKNRDRLKLFCNVVVGRDIKFDELCADYDAVVLAYGARRQRRLEIPGIESKNVFLGGDFVFWYNGMYGAKTPLLDCREAVIVGNGNVALDCSRIILSSGMDRLSSTDIPTSVLELLSQSKIRHVTIIGRRGPLDVSFTRKELREQINLPSCSFSVEIDSSDAIAAKDSLQSSLRPRKRITELILNSTNIAKSKADRHCQLLFRRMPIKVLADNGGRVRAVEVIHALSGQMNEIPCGLLLCCVGFENVALEGVPTDENNHIKMLDTVRVATEDQTLVYASGWCAHVPQGVIAKTQVDSSNVADRLCYDFQKYGLKKTQITGSEQRLIARNIRYLTWNDWKKVDEEEKKLGAAYGREREKLLDIYEKFVNS